MAEDDDHRDDESQEDGGYEREHARVPDTHYSPAEFDRRFKELGRTLQTLPPDVTEFFFFMRGRIEMLERDAREFVPRSDIEKIADQRALLMFRSFGFNTRDIPETASQVKWLMSLKRSVRGFGALLGVSFVGALFTLGTTFIASRWGK